MRRKQLYLILFSLLFMSSVSGQEQLTLDIESAKEYALQFNKTIKNSGLSVIQSQEQLKEAIAAGLPQVNATTDYTNSMGAEISIQFDPNSPASKIPIKPTSNFNLQVGQLLFNGSYLVGVQSAKLYGKLTEKSKIKTEQDVVSQVVENYYLVLVSGQTLDILKVNMDNLKTIYNKTKPMVSVGMMEKVELDQLSVQVNALNNAVRAAERQYEMTQNMLRLQLGVSADTKMILTEKLADITAALDKQTAISDSFLISQNIDYQLLNVQEKISEKQVDLQKAAYLPTLSGYYSFTHKILKPAFDMSPANVVGLQLDIPVFSSGERRAKVKQAKIDLETTKNNKALLEDQLSIQYKQLRFNLLSAIESYENQKENVKVSREVYKSLKSKYEHGMISSLDLTTADNNYLQAETDYLSAVLEVLRAQNDLDTLTGKVNN